MMPRMSSTSVSSLVGSLPTVAKPKSSALHDDFKSCDQLRTCRYCGVANTFYALFGSESGSVNCVKLRCTFCGAAIAMKVTEVTSIAPPLITTGFEKPVDPKA